MTGAPAHTPAPEPVPARRAPAVAVLDPTVPGLPATLVLRGALDAATAPDLGAAVATAAGTGRLLVDVSEVDRFDPAAWAALAGACARTVQAGASVHVAGLRWAQVLDVLAAVPITHVAALMAGMRVLLPHPDEQAPDSTPGTPAGTIGWLRAPSPSPPPGGIAPGGLQCPDERRGLSAIICPETGPGPSVGPVMRSATPTPVGNAWSISC